MTAEQETVEEILTENIKRLQEDFCKNLLHVKELNDKLAVLQKIELRAGILSNLRARETSTPEELEEALTRLLGAINGEG